MFTEQLWQQRHSEKLKAGFMGVFLHEKLLWAHFRKSIPFLNLKVLRVFKKSQGWAAATEYETAVVWQGSGSPYSFSSTAVLTELDSWLSTRYFAWLFCAAAESMSCLHCTPAGVAWKSFLPKCEMWCSSASWVSEGGWAGITYIQASAWKLLRRNIGYIPWELIVLQSPS